MYFLLAESVIAAKENNNHRDYSQSRPHASKLYQPGVHADIFSLFLNIKLVYLHCSFYCSHHTVTGVGWAGTLVCQATRWCVWLHAGVTVLHAGVAGCMLV